MPLIDDGRLRTSAVPVALISTMALTAAALSGCSGGTDHAGGAGGGLSTGATGGMTEPAGGKVGSGGAATGGSAGSAQGEGVAGNGAGGSSGSPQTLRFDLRADFSDSANPNGAWSYDQEDEPLPHLDSWLAGESHDSSPPQPAWAVDPGVPDPALPPQRYQPAIFKSSGFATWLPPSNWAAAGDIIVATSDPTHSRGNGRPKIRWTSPVAGTAKLDVRLWIDARPGGYVGWDVLVRGTGLAYGNLEAGGPYTRSNPAQLAGNASSPADPTTADVARGDDITLQLTTVTMNGSYVGVNMTIVVTVP